MPTIPRLHSAQVGNSIQNTAPVRQQLSLDRKDNHIYHIPRISSNNLIPNELHPNYTGSCQPTCQLKLQFFTIKEIKRGSWRKVRNHSTFHALSSIERDFDLSIRESSPKPSPVRDFFADLVLKTPTLSSAPVSQCRVISHTTTTTTTNNNNNNKQLIKCSAPILKRANFIQQKKENEEPISSCYHVMEKRLPCGSILRRRCLHVPFHCRYYSEIEESVVMLSSCARKLVEYGRLLLKAYF